MKAKNKVVYVPPVYEEVQHEVTSVDDKNNPLRTSFHTDVSLLQRIDNMRADAQTLREIKESLQPMIDTSNFRAQFEETFGSLTDDELINSCPSRYTQTASEKMSYLKELAAAGACGFTDDGIPLKNAAFLYKAMEEAKALDLPISLHEEDPAFIETNGINHGPVSDALGIYGSPSIAEESLVARDCLLALRSGAQVVIQHISSGQSVELVRTFKAMGANLHAEATPHHFTLTDEAVLKYGSLAKMNPPLRTEKDRLAIIEGLKDGTIDLIATDHAPHSTEEKSRPITQTPSGIIGLETSLALGITSLVRPGHLTLSQLIEKMTINPANLYHLPCGSVTEGKAADLVLFDPNEKWIPETYASKSSNSPFTGWELYGKVKYTICDGKIVYKD